MRSLDTDKFICIDCESTGLNTKSDQIIELAAVIFTFNEIIDTFDTLINPRCLIPEDSKNIHNISQDMVKNKPFIEKILPQFLKFVGKDITIVGHGILFDIEIISNAAQTHQIPCNILSMSYIDTLRLARLYGESPANSLQNLRKHFNIEEERAHRAMDDVLVNIEVFKYLTQSYKTKDDILQRLKKPIRLKRMPLGKYKGRRFEDIPLEYLFWAAKQDFDQDLLFSLRTEINKRKKGSPFQQAGNPFINIFDK